jgi:hypothetical protein
MGSKEKLLYSSTSPIVTVILPQTSPSLSTSDEMPEEIKSEYLRRTNSSSSIVTLGLFISFSYNRTSLKNSYCFSDTYQSTAAYNNVHSQLWKGLTALEHDIFPDVAATAQKLTKYIRQKVSILIIFYVYQNFYYIQLSHFN